MYAWDVFPVLNRVDYGLEGIPLTFVVFEAVGSTLFRTKGAKVFDTFFFAELGDQVFE